MWTLWLALAVAQAPDDEPASERIVVYDQLRVDQARDEVIATLRGQGYTEMLLRDDHVILRHPDPWRGEILLFDDGWIRVKRQPVQYEPPPLFNPNPKAGINWLACVLAPPTCWRVGGQVVSRRKFAAQRERVMAEVHDEAETFADRVADRETELTANALADRLQVLWDTGSPLEDGPPLVTIPERRRALFEYWDTRTETPQGARVRDVVRTFLDAVVQTTAPFPADEIAALNEARRSARPLLLETPALAVPSDSPVPGAPPAPAP
jgi:hypothetical protein